MKKIVILSLVVLLSACGKKASTTAEATSTVASATPAAEAIASSTAAEESTTAVSTAELSEDEALTAFLSTTVEHVKLSSKDLYPSGTVSMYADPSGYSDTQYPYVKKTNETWKNMLKKIQDALESAVPADGDLDSLNEDDLAYTFALDDDSKTVVSLYRDGHVKTVNGNGERHLYTIDSYADLLKFCAQYTAEYDSLIKEMTTEASAQNAAAAATDNLPAYIDVKVTSVSGNIVHVDVEGTDLTLDLTKIDNCAGTLKEGDVIRVSTSVQALDTFAVIENAERITKSSGK